MLKMHAKNSKQWQKQNMIKELLLAHINTCSELLRKQNLTIALNLIKQTF